MVIRVNRFITTDDIQLIGLLIEERQGGRHRDFFNEIQDQWKERIKKYIEVGGNPESLEPWEKVTEKNIKGRFNNLYGSAADESVQKPILQALHKWVRDFEFCPCCGEDGTPNTLDHYLPKDEYPEFSVTPANLVPMCDICQGEKLTDTLNDQDQRIFLHPYFDGFLNQQVVLLKIGEPFTAPESFLLLPHPSLKDEQQKLVARHLDGLGIEKRYSHFFRGSYTRLLRLTQRAREKELDVRDQIEQFHDNALDKSMNSWAQIFFNGVLQNGKLLDFLATEELPQV